MSTEQGHELRQQTDGEPQKAARDEIKVLQAEETVFSKGSRIALLLNDYVTHCPI